MKNTVANLERKKCTGCGSCYNKCPVNAIAMIEDEEGFPYPVINEAACTNCGLCEKACPEFHSVPFGAKEPECYAVWANDEVRRVSSSGGMFTLMADYVLEQGGYVCGAVYAEDFRKVYHTVIDCREKLPPLRKSKYVQSDTGTVYNEIKGLLKNNKPVLFCGCPCQVAGLYGYLGENDSNLITVDFVCHGAPSPKAYRSFIDEIRGHKTIESVDFRSKENGWTHSVLVSYENDISYTESKSDFWFRGYLNGYSTRRACSECSHANKQRVADITMADFWGVGKLNKDWDDGKGTSLVLLNSAKGQAVFDSMRERMILCERADLDFAVENNISLREPAYKNPMRGCFFKHLDKDGFKKSMRYVLKQIFDVGVVGWWYGINYGSILTYYALYQTLREMDLSVIMIRPPMYADNEKENFRTVFAKKHYRISTYRPNDRIHELNDYCDAYIIGSDQLWNYYCDYSHHHMLDFASDDKIKISYATSFGHAKSFFPDGVLQEAAYHMRRLDYVSVREYDGVKLARDIFGVEAEQVLDPVFLCDKRAYEKLADESGKKTRERFLFAYILDPDDEKKLSLSYVAKALNLKLVSIVDRQMDYEKKIDTMRDCNVIADAITEDLIFHLLNSQFIITDSFHGTCFSIIFNKPFITIMNKQRGPSRFESLLPGLGLMNRLVNDPAEVRHNPALLQPIDYAGVNEALAIERDRSLKWLATALNTPKPKAFSASDILNRKNAELYKMIVEMKEQMSELETKTKQEKS